MANITGVIFGDTGTFKTSNLGYAAIYCYEKTGKPVRYVSADGGKWRPIQPLVDAGIIIPFSILTIDEPLAVIRKIAQGYWPIELADGQMIGSRMEQNSHNGGEAGGYIFEGITSMAELLQERYRGEKLGTSPAFKGTIKSALQDEKGKALEDEVFGASAIDHYGFIPQEITRRVVQSWDLKTEMVLWSAHEAQGEDEISRVPIIGPALIGQKATSKLGKNLGFLIHAEAHNVEKITGQQKAKTIEVRYHFQSHPHQTLDRVNYKCKTRIPPDKVNDLLAVYPDGYFVPDTKDRSSAIDQYAGLDSFLRLEDGLLLDSGAKWLKWKKNLMRNEEYK